MKVLDKLINMRKGEVITDKRILCALKRAGVIYDYTQWGYLESQWVYFISTWDGKEHIDRELTYGGPEIKPGELGSCENPYKEREDRMERYGCYIDIEYKGILLRTKYLDGCFNAYLYKAGGLSNSDETVNRTMSIYGAIV